MRGRSPREEIFTAISPLKPLIFEAILAFGDPPDCASVAARTGSRQCSAHRLQRTPHEMCRECFHNVEFEDSAKMTDTILALRGRD